VFCSVLGTIEVSELWIVPMGTDRNAVIGSSSPMRRRVLMK